MIQSDLAMISTNLFMSTLWFMELNSLRPRQNGRHLPDDIFKCIFLNENVWMSLKITQIVSPYGVTKPWWVNWSFRSKYYERKLVWRCCLQNGDHFTFVRRCWNKLSWKCVPDGPNENNAVLVQMMAWSHDHATSFYLNQCLPRSKTQYVIYMPQLVK